MRKVLLFATLLIGAASIAIAQSSARPELYVKGKGALAIPSEKNYDKMPDNVGFNYVTTSQVYQAKRANPIYTNTAVTNLGFTYYDLMTNASIAPRLVNYGNGKVSAVWTLATEGGASYPSRGTAYNTYDGTAWSGANADRLEGTIRTGWPNIALMGNSKEIIISHDPQVYGMQQGTNAAQGSTSWTFGVSSATSSTFCPNGGAIWVRMAVSGDNGQYVHVIANSSDSTCKKQGIKQPFAYSRSSDFGATWAIVNQPMPGFDSTVTLVCGGDDYMIDARDSVVAIVRGGLGESVILWKSMDNGTTFTKSYVDSFPMMPDLLETGTVTVPPDTFDTNDAAVALFIDKNYVVHVTYPFMQTLLMNNTAGDPAQAYIFGHTTLVKWDDLSATKQFLTTPFSVLDEDLDGDYTVGSNTFAFAIDLANGDTAAARYRNSSLLTMPTMAGDDNGNMFIVFSLPHDNDILLNDGGTGTNGQSFRDVWVRASNDGGATWDTTNILNLTCSFGVEDAFPTAAKLVDDSLHIMFMSDDEPGTALTNEDDPRSNDMNYIKVPISKIFDGTAGCQYSNVRSLPANELFSVSNNYPNPFNNETYVDINLKKASKVLLTVRNLLGQTVQVVDYSTLTTGNHTLSVNAQNFTSGIYFMTLSAGDYTVTKKMIVQK